MIVLIVRRISLVKVWAPCIGVMTLVLRCGAAVRVGRGGAAPVCVNVGWRGRLCGLRLRWVLRSA